MEEANPGDPNQCFIIERILGCREIEGVTYYATKWEGSDDITLEPEEKFHCSELIREYHAAGALNILDDVKIQPSMSIRAVLFTTYFRVTKPVKDHWTGKLKPAVNLQQVDKYPQGMTTGNSSVGNTYDGEEFSDTPYQTVFETSVGYREILSKFMTNLQRLPQKWVGKAFFIYGPKTHPEVKSLRRYLATRMTEDPTCNSTNLATIFVGILEHILKARGAPLGHQPDIFHSESEPTKEEIQPRVPPIWIYHDSFQ
ncbi:hypothetical protein K493DRAFT_307872 [Basidiobolus meristosporus CBS 931.73]|uniref:Chromo domain-containing protein n=1 Tax=Basidiobolus meristosporus CBS 931.73 TaxID=1314790 RepID=A0A1Y1X923_9FUNG|nr:hypothetical protein K493DRAFT_307872 [Basidiobolus meristosporus CBS 931.73]|eukprot:ORX82242.1 hypothetical protein K493DRAFT_307872 [Basidiobolus meristosporus CBS 931.73]